MTCSAMCPAVIHIAQLWFHGRITREESHRIIHQQGQVDGYGWTKDMAIPVHHPCCGLDCVLFFFGPTLSCCTGCFWFESVRVTPRRSCSRCAITRKSNISRSYRYALPVVLALLAHEMPLRWVLSYAGVEGAERERTNSSPPRH